VYWKTQQVVITVGECPQRIISRTVYTASLLLDPVVSLLSLLNIITTYWSWMFIGWRL